MLAFYKMITEQLKNRTWFNFHRERFNSVEIINRESEIYRVEPRGNIDNEIWTDWNLSIRINVAVYLAMFPSIAYAISMVSLVTRRIYNLTGVA